ncbi:Oidioi.mRNA.OKI2018_I69.chr1.g1039.t1.cds [Oikopleura dioica]|uniref:Oidioi.mRNA.OKI2018_I69.chr1.g1039.t1.cds n=1 Tax=Oikopleura dioica TaxID=34765 RepID=A0ABN7SQY3_OIKDI|nr:Oidioi.mRNA.OKI2018_I69.chr1.g1039.t1.cds [Oikopleura dioica]
MKIKFTQNEFSSHMAFAVGRIYETDQNSLVDTQDLVELRINGDYTSEDASGIQKWLSGIGREFSQYTFHLIQAGVDRDFLPHLTDEHLKVDCQITNGVHRTKILEAVRRDEGANGHDDVQDPKDVFVCSWKEGQLLSESLCAYLRLRSFSVATNWGLIPKSDEVTLRHESNIAHAGHFLLVLTPGCLENLIQNACEDENTLALDPFYRWIVTAFAKGCNIIPMVAPGWKWPVPDSVPEAIRDLCFMNGVRWRWGYQEEIINRLQRFMTDHGSLQSLTSVNRAQSKMSMASTTHGEYVLPTPAENLSRQPSQRSITSVTSRPSLRSFGGSPQADTGSQRSRHSSRASVASQQISKKSVNVPVEYESTEPSPEPISDPEIEIDDHLQPVASSKDATDPDDEPLDMLISKVEKDLKVQSALPIEDDLPKDESPLPSPEKVPEKAESSLTAASLESASPPNTPDKKKSSQSSPKSTTNQSNDTPPIVIDDSDEDDGENNDESLSEDAMTTVTELTMSSTISSASAKLKKGISKRLGKAKTKTSKAFSKGLKGLKNSSEKLKSSLKRGDKKKADKGNEEEKEELEDISDEKETNSSPEVIEKTSGDDNKIEVEVVVEEKAEEAAPETEPDSGVIIEKESAVLDTVVEETAVVVEKQGQPVSETKSDESKDEPEKEASTKIEAASDSIEKAPVTEAETVEVSDEPEKSEPSETTSVPSEQVSVEPDSVKDSAPEIEAPKEPETPVESSSVSESTPAPEISSEPVSKEPENSKEPESEEKSEPTVAQALAQDFLTSESAEPTEPVEPAEPETEPSSATAKQNNTPKKGGKKKNKKRKK